MPTINGTSGNDVLFGTPGDDEINGFDGNDQLFAEEGDDTLNGGDGNDALHGGSGTDSYDGGGGAFDGIYFNNPFSTRGVVADLRTQTVYDDGFGNIETFIGVEGFGSGTRFADTFYGDDNPNQLIGGSGGDVVYGFGGNDGINIEGAAALIDGGDGRDVVNAFRQARFVDLNNDGITEEETTTNGVHIDLSLGMIVDDGFGGSGMLVSIEDLTGSAGDDILIGDDGGNILDGDGGDDRLEGRGGADNLLGEDGDDLLIGGDGADFIDGGAGMDSLEGGNDADLLIGGAGDDALDGGDGNDTLRSDGFPGYNGPSGNDTLTGGGGDDAMWGGAGTDSYDGGEGRDRISFYAFAATQGAVANLITQTVSNDGFGNAETMVSIEGLGGTAHADHFTGDDNRNFMHGGRADTLIGNGGNDDFQLESAPALLDGGDGVDTITLFVGDIAGTLVPDSDDDGLAELVFAASGVHVDLGLGAIVDDGYGNSGTLVSIENVGGSGLDDILIGDGNDNLLTGFGGDDLLAGGLGNDTLDGGGGNDTASYAAASGDVTVNLGSPFPGASGADGEDILIGIEHVIGSGFDDLVIGNGFGNVLAGLEGADTINGGAGDDLIEGGEGNDTVSGQQGNDQVFGGGGHDFLRGNAGDDLLDGGDGFDRVSFFPSGLGHPSVGVTVSLLLQGQAQDTGHGMDTLVGVEALSGSFFDDTLIGDHEANWLIGGGAPDSGNDTLRGEGGDDLLEVGQGDHVLDGGAGTDTASLYGLGNTLGAANVSLMLQGTPQDTGKGMMTLTSIENLSGTAFDDSLIGDREANLLGGDEGSDSLSGGDGDDILYGDGAVAVALTPTFTASGVETFVDRGTGNDVLDGGRGDDLLLGGGGNDMLTGGKGTDRFEFGDGSGHDQITDFERKETIAILDVPGVDDFSDLTIVQAGRDTVISWAGGAASVTLDGFKAKHLSASNFDFGDAAPAALAMAPDSFFSRADFAMLGAAEFV